ncbi:MAG: murein transglycosylase A [Rhodobacteraceae bacterium]|nr:murein transglycosylase A [Paracoccaceae bacterium]
MRRALAGAVMSGLLASGGANPAQAEVSHRILSFSELEGWEEDDHAAALAVFLETCPDLPDPEWQALCALATQAPAARPFFELLFRPVLIGGEAPALFTGYYEPELDGSRQRTARFRYPLYRPPGDLPPDGLWYSRAEIEDGRLMEGRGLEIAWVDDPVELFFLQIQGSGRIRLAEGGVLRVGYGGTNGHPYRSIGAELVRRGVLGAHEVSAEAIRAWVRRNPEEGAALLRHNPSYVFFREIEGVPPDRGPLGAMNRSVTPLRSIAVDPAFTPLGAPVWIETAGLEPMRRLMVAQDTGSAIRGAQRADIFFGTGEEAGRRAGRVRDPGRMVVLLPIQKAYALAPGG